MKHLKDNKVSYAHHWVRAMKMSVALFIHAWMPDLLEYYASDQLRKVGKKSFYKKGTIVE
jgi:hypothetical protein